MRNEGPRTIVILLMVMSVMGFLTAELPIVGGVVLVIGAIGVVIYAIWKAYKRLTFPAPFIDPNEEQRALISDYFEQVEEAGKKVKVKPTGLVLLFGFIFLTVLVMSIGEKRGSFWPGLISVCIVIGIFLAVAYFSEHHNTSRFQDYKIAKVEFYDASYNQTYSPSSSIYTTAFGKAFAANMTSYYVFVRLYEGEKIKLKVPEYIHSYVAAESLGVGYMIKYRHKSGIFDLYDFVPEYRNKRYGSRSLF